jgi:hypothetical protein
MSENLVCTKCGREFDNRQEFQKHAQSCTGQGAQQAAPDRPMTRGAGGGRSASE